MDQEISPPFSRHLAITLSPSRHSPGQSPSIFRQCNCCKDVMGSGGSPLRGAALAEESFQGPTTTSVQRDRSSASRPWRATGGASSSPAVGGDFADDWLRELSKLLGSAHRYSRAGPPPAQESTTHGSASECSVCC